MRYFVRHMPYTEDDDVQSASSLEQSSVERECMDSYVQALASFCMDDEFHHGKEMRADSEQFEATFALFRKAHRKFLLSGLERLPSSFGALDASMPWIVYWIVHALDILGELDNLPSSLKSRCVRFLNRCKTADGGYGGGPHHLAHLAPTYAAVHALVAIGTEEALESIDRAALLRFFMSRKQEDGSFTMHDDGESDTRAAYTVLSVAKLVNILTDELTQGVATQLAKHQTFEGGFGPEPGVEAHGGYTFCAAASLQILRAWDSVDLPRLTHWLAHRQMPLEGGFQGRTNKLVDGCYSFWQGAALPIVCDAFRDLDARRQSARGDRMDEYRPLFSTQALQEYILLCCQRERGGLIDKPGKFADFYHTCYCLSGLAIAQQWCDEIEIPINALQEVDYIHNVVTEKVARAQHFFAKSSADCEA